MNLAARSEAEQARSNCLRWQNSYVGESLWLRLYRRDIPKLVVVEIARFGTILGGIESPSVEVQRIHKCSEVQVRLRYVRLMGSLER